jgi:dolichol kinase
MYTYISKYDSTNSGNVVLLNDTQVCIWMYIYRHIYIWIFISVFIFIMYIYFLKDVVIGLKHDLDMMRVREDQIREENNVQLESIRCSYMSESEELRKAIGSHYFNIHIYISIYIHIYMHIYTYM